MKSFKSNAGYYLTGYMAGKIAQYSVFKNGHGWTVNRTIGNGPEFNQLFKTKSEAYKLVRDYSDN